MWPATAANCTTHRRAFAVHLDHALANRDLFAQTSFALPKEFVQTCFLDRREQQGVMDVSRVSSRLHCRACDRYVTFVVLVHVVGSEFVHETTVVLSRSSGYTVNGRQCPIIADDNSLQSR